MVSQKCKVRLENPPNCTDRKLVLGYVMCSYWDGIKNQGLDKSAALTAAWGKVHEKCGKEYARPTS